jgi:cyclic-di-GMP phosphodiesterase TipF (flagellum assembly factor)
VPAPAVLKPAEPNVFAPKPVDPKPLELKPAAGATPLAEPGRMAGGRFKDMDQAAVIQMIRDAVDNNRIDLFLQPIVTLPQRKVRYYEAVARLRAADGEQLMAADFLPYAEAGGLMPKIDNMMLFRCVQVVRRLLAKNREIGLFCNVSATTLIDSQTFPQFAEFMEANKAIAPALVFEFTQSALRGMGPIENESLAALAQRGYRFSLDNVTDLRIEPRDLAERGFRFVKVQAPLLLNKSGIAISDIHPQDFAGLLSRHGIELVAAKIESESAVVDLLDYDVKFGQGFLFSPPRPVRPEVMQGISNDVVVRGDGNASPKVVSPPPPPIPPVTSAAPPVTHRLSSLAQLARGAVARN